MKTGRGIGIGLLLAALGTASAARADGHFSGRVLDGTPDYSDEAFGRLERVVAGGEWKTEAGAQAFGEALAAMMNPRGPIADARVVLRSAGAEPGERETMTDAKGHFHFAPYPYGEYVLTITTPASEARASQTLVWRLRKDDYGQEGDEFVFPAEFVAARGTVRDSAGHPLAGIGIVAEEYAYGFELQKWRPAAHVVKTTTDAEGHFELGGLHPAVLWFAWAFRGDYLVHAEGAGFAPQVREIKVLTKTVHGAAGRMLELFRKVAPEDRNGLHDVKLAEPADAHGVLAGVDFTLTAAAAMTGRVQDETGAPIGDVTLVLAPGDGLPEMPYPLTLRKTARSDGNGTFRFDALLPGHYVVKASAAGYAAREIRCEVAEGQTRDLPVALARSGTVIVDVARNGTRTVPKYLVTEGGECSIFWTGRTNEKGLCVFDGLPPGENRIRASFASYTNGTCERFEEIRVAIESGQTNQAALAVDGECAFDLELAFDPNGAVRAWLNPASAPVVSDFWKDDQLKAFRWVESPGRVAFENLPAGDYRLSVQHLEPGQNMKSRPWIPDQTQTIRLEEGQRPLAAFEF
ncbi:MAG: carboxypeptidase regulatory-like domain-containing protein [Kiritimatiellia bacterium]